MGLNDRDINVDDLSRDSQLLREKTPILKTPKPSFLILNCYVRLGQNVIETTATRETKLWAGGN